MGISIEQCRAARALLDWSASDLAQRSAVGVATVRRFEAGQIVQAGSIEAIQQALEQAGIMFIEPGEVSKAGGAGARLTV